MRIWSNLWKIVAVSMGGILFFAGCNGKKETKKLEVNLSQLPEVNITSPKIVVYQLGKELNLTFKNGKLVDYPPKRTYLLFTDGGKFSKIEERFLKELEIPYYPVRDSDLAKEFNISEYPTIVILDRNRTIKYEGFTPYEILKAEKYFHTDFSTLDQNRSHLLLSPDSNSTEKVVDKKRGEKKEGKEGKK